MSDKRAEPETYTLRNRAGEAAELMAKAASGDADARAAYSRLLVEESRSFGVYFSKKIGSKLQKAS